MQRSPPIRVWHTLLVCGPVWLAACDVPGVTVVRPEAATTQAELAIHVALEDSSVAQALGWAAGVPGATVVFHRFIDPFRPETLLTDAAGRVTVRDLLPGWYLVAGYRVLTAEETGPTGGAVRAFGDGRKLNFTGGGSLDLSLGMDQPGSLVFSEYFSGGGTLETLGYDWAQFYELYNNGDTTVYLDGMLLGWAYGRFGSQNPCAENEPFREDPQGLWSWFFHQFPGRGADYPVAPGGTVVIAMDAADHSQAHPSFPDLSGADFELEGAADVDNPDVPNLREVGPQSDRRGHGMYTGDPTVLYLALPVDVAGLTKGLVGGSEHAAARIPGDRIVDVRHGDWVDPDAEPPFVYDEYCSYVNREFDRLASPWYRPSGDSRISQHRKVVRTDNGSRVVLQDVNTSFVDWVLSLYSPGRIEY